MKGCRARRSGSRRAGRWGSPSPRCYWRSRRAGPARVGVCRSRCGWPCPAMTLPGRGFAHAYYPAAVKLLGAAAGREVSHVAVCIRHVRRLSARNPELGSGASCSGQSCARVSHHVGQPPRRMTDLPTARSLAGQRRDGGNGSHNITANEGGDSGPVATSDRFNPSARSLMASVLRSAGGIACRKIVPTKSPQRRSAARR